MLLNKLKKIPVGVRAAVVYTMASVFSRGLAMISMPIFTRIMTTAEIGAVNMYNSWYDLLHVFATLALTSGGFQAAMKDFPDEKSEYQSSILTLTSFMAIFMAGIYYVSPQFWNGIIGLNTELMSLMLISLIFAPAQEFWLLRQRYEFKYKSVGILSIGTAFIGTFLAIVTVLMLNEQGSSKVVEGRLIATKSVIIIVAIVLWISIFLKGKVFYSKKFWKYSIAVCLPLLGHSLATKVLNVSDRIMISKMVSDSAVGIYSTLFTVSSIPSMVWSAINSSFVPYLFANLSRKENKLKNISLSLISAYAIIAIVMTFFAPEIVRILATEEYYESIYIMPPIASGVFLTSISNMYSNILVYHKKTKYIMYSSVIAAGVNIILNYIFIHKFGYMAAAYTTLLAHIILAGVQAFYARKVHRQMTGEKTIYHDKAVLILAVGTVLVTSLGLFLYKLTILRYIVIVIGAFVGVALAFDTLKKMKK